jgi:hypothetical protein
MVSTWTPSRNKCKGPIRLLSADAAGSPAGCLAGEAAAPLRTAGTTRSDPSKLRRSQRQAVRRLAPPFTHTTRVGIRLVEASFDRGRPAAKA